MNNEQGDVDGIIDQVDSSTQEQLELGLGIDENSGDDEKKVDMEIAVERGPEPIEKLFEDGYIAQMYRQVEEGKIKRAPGWDPEGFGYYKNR